MYYPSLRKKAAQQLVTNTFAGLNRAEKIGDGEWHEAMNLSTREYPMLCPRKPRGTVRTLSAPAGMIAKERLCWIDGATEYYGGAAVAGISVSTDAGMLPKRLVSMGAYVLIFPDKVYFNTIDFTDCGSMEGSFTTSGTVQYRICRLDGSDFENITVSDTEPQDPENGDYWLDTGVENHRLMLYSAYNGYWQQVLTVYVRVIAPGIGVNFEIGDTVELSGIEAGAEADESLQKQLADLNGSHYIYNKTDNSLTIVGLVDTEYSQTEGTVAAQRNVPDMEFVIESENRLWGCHYGKDAEGNTLNELYACKLGDFKNWRVYQGISTDSYTVSIGSDGPFTGAITYGGYPMFFKQDCVHKVFGAQPKNFQVMTTQLRGVQEGSDRSLCIVDGVLLYLSSTGVEAYEGSLPVCISGALGDRARCNGVAGSLGSRYYISVMEENVQRLYVYDQKTNIWLEETAINAMAFVRLYDELYALDEDNGKMITMQGSVGTSEGEVEWSAETGLMGWEVVDQKYLTRYNVRAVIPPEGRINIYLQYDSTGTWRQKMQYISQAQTTRTVLMPVYPRRCDHLRMRISGQGEVKVYSIARVLTSGGDGQRG